MVPIKNSDNSEYLFHRLGNGLDSENTFYGDQVYCFPGGGFSIL